VHYWGCDDPIWRQDDLNGLNPNIPVVNAILPNVLGRPPREFFEADVGDPLRVKFWYDPADGKDVYVNTWLVPGGDITPPSIISVRESEDPICEAGTGSPSQVIIRADVSDPCGVAWVRLHYRAPGGSWQFVTMTPEGGDTYAATVGPFAQSGTMEYYVEAADNCGNVGETAHYSVTVEDCGGDEPAIANIRVSAAPLCRETTGSPDTTTVRADVTHPSGIDWVQLHYQPPGGSWTSKAMSFEAGDTYAATVGPFSQAGLLNYYVEAMPNLGDPGESPHQAVIVENCGGDISPPDIDNITESDDPICRQGTGIPDIITIGADVSDPSGVNWAHLHYQQLPGSMWTWVPMSLVIGDTYEDTIGPFSQIGIYSYYVRARDWVGNEIQSDLSTFVVVECTGPTPTQTQTPTTTPTMPTPTPTATLPPGETGAIQGKVLLQGRANHSGVQVTAGGVSGMTASNGGFTIPGVPAGTHSVMAEMAGYLEHVKIGVVVPAGMTVPLLDVRLLGGDASGDCTINLFDLVTVALNYGSTTPTVPAADINGNGVVDLFDLVMTAVNLDLGCPGAWPVPPAFDLQAAAPIHLRVSPETQSLQIGDEFEVTLELQEASNLYGADVTLTFDPDVLEVVDADPTTQGVQISRGTFPNPDQGIVTKEEADNTAGTANYAMSLKTPAQPAAGDGTLCMIRFRAKARGTSDLAISAATLLDPNADPIEVMSHDGSINVTAEVHNVFLPVIFRSETDR
jgi:hypothetical protein